MLKRKLVYLTSASILLTATPLAFAGTNFGDIDGSYAKDAILKLADQGILNGNGNGQFNPTGRIDRQDFAIILAKSLKLDVSDSPKIGSFNDVPPDHYSFAYVEAAKKAGLIEGMGDGTFGTGSELTREQMAVIFVRALGTDPKDKGKDLIFSDNNAISDWAKDSVGAAVELDLISGNSDGTFSPQGNAERQAVAIVASKFLEVAESQSPTPTPEPTTMPEPTPAPTPEPTPEPAPTNPTNPTNPTDPNSANSAFQ